MSYETDNLSGVIIRADEETDAPELTYPLGLTGWHGVSVGMYVGEDEAFGKTPVMVHVRLTKEDTATRLTILEVKSGEGEEIHELFWKFADLTDQDLVLTQQKWRVAEGEAPGCIKGHNSRVAYIKVVPLSEAEIADVQTDRSDNDTRKLFLHNDAHGYQWHSRPTEPEHVRQEIEPFRDTDYGRLYWECAGGDLLNYPGNTGRLPTLPGLDDFAGQGDRMHRESWETFLAEDIDPFRVALDHAHGMGLEFHASYRVTAFQFPPDHDHFHYGEDAFYLNHPELRGTDREGRLTPRLSYAYPEMREYVISVLTEVVSTYDVDGICLLYNRRPPFVEYDPSLVDGFKDEYGLDPLQLEDDDPRWLRYRCLVMTKFMREVRKAMQDEAQKQGGRTIEVSAIVMRNEQENLYYGMDLKAWIDEGLVDTIIPYTSEVFLDSDSESWSDPRDIEYFVELTRGTPCKLAPNIMPRHMSAEAYRKRAAGLYERGVGNLFFWDCVPEARGNGTSSWTALRRLGHKEEVRDWMDSGAPEVTMSAKPVRSLDGWDNSYATPG